MLLKNNGKWAIIINVLILLMSQLNISEILLFPPPAAGETIKSKKKKQETFIWRSNNAILRSILWLLN